MGKLGEPGKALAVGRCPDGCGAAKSPRPPPRRLAERVLAGHPGVGRTQAGPRLRSTFGAGGEEAMATPAAGTVAQHGAGHAAGGLRGLTLAALGVAYGDIGTS